MDNVRTATSRSSYRPDVDGLRAVAVLLVLADHFALKLRGGYVGVDVFFVISGYLIGGILLSDISAERFSIVSFYERRARRILPALFVLIAVVTVLVYFLFVPGEIQAYARSVLATIFSLSNFLFWRQSGYFDDASLIKPLLHTWSLAVEEQFYIFFPLFLLAVHRYFRKWMKFSIFAVAIITFVAAVIVAKTSSTAAFYLAPLRAWELMIGAIISQPYLPAIKTRVSRNIASAGGLLLILIPAWFYTGFTVFPGLLALPPCVGAALIVAAGETGDSIAGRLLALRPVVFIGLTSYSVYLWHWPLLVFQRTNSLLPGDMSKTPWKIFMIVLSLVLGAISWAVVEQPFRKGRFRPNRRGVFVVNGVAAAVVALAAVVLIAFHGFPGRFPEQAQKVAAYADAKPDAAYREGTCFLTPEYSFADFRRDTCLKTTPGRPSILLAGDSHSAHLWPGFASVFKDHDVMQATASGCHPVLVEPDWQRTACKQLSTFIFRDYLLHHHVDVLVLSGRWSKADVEPLTQTIQYLKAHQVFTVLIGPGLEFDTPLPRLLAISIRNHHELDASQHITSDSRLMDARMRQLANDRWHIPYVSIFKYLCKAECPVYAKPAVPMLFDTNHLTPDGSVVVASSILANHELDAPAVNSSQ